LQLSVGAVQCSGSIQSSGGNLVVDSERVVIAGGGLAGLAAAVALTNQGIPVTLLEARERLGGRATSYPDSQTGELVDNCQHVSMGCCTNLRWFCETVAVADRFDTAEQLTFIDRAGEATPFRASRLPAPLHLLPAFARIPYLTWRDKLRLARALRRLARLRPDSPSQTDSFLDWLRSERQSDAAISCFWEVVLVSALSETLDRIDIGHARKVFVDGFLRNRAGWEVHIPQVPLDQLFGAPVITWLQARGANVRTHTAVTELRGSGGIVTEVVTRAGESLVGGDFVLALPSDRLAPLIANGWSESPGMTELRQSLERFEFAPITSLHFWLDRPLCDLPHAVLLERTSQWVFRRAGASSPHEATGRSGFQWQVVVSASRSLKGLPREQVRDAVLTELRDAFPVAREAQLFHWRMVTESRAVFSPVPGIEQWRPPQQSPIPNLQLAGDWTATGWPATMEGAVRSGLLAAQNILARRGQPTKLLQPDLPAARLARWLFGLRD
jgi:squalene-associated FAD-dependent desaturase